jgi:hypothetical protein
MINDDLIAIIAAIIALVFAVMLYARSHNRKRAADKNEQK